MPSFPTHLVLTGVPAISCPTHLHSLPLLQLKLRRGPTFSTAKEGHTHLFELLASQGRHLALVAPRETLMLHAVPSAEMVPTSSDAQGVEAALGLLGNGGGSGNSGGGVAGGEQQQQQQQREASGGPAGGEQGPAEQQQQQQQREANAGPAGGEQGPAAQQQHNGSERRLQRRPPDLLYLQLADFWGHLEDGALQLAAQVRTGGESRVGGQAEGVGARSRGVMCAEADVVGQGRHLS